MEVISIIQSICIPNYYEPLEVTRIVPEDNYAWVRGEVIHPRHPLHFTAPSLVVLKEINVYMADRELELSYLVI